MYGSFLSGTLNYKVRLAAGGLGAAQHIEVDRYYYAPTAPRTIVPLLQSIAYLLVAGLYYGCPILSYSLLTKLHVFRVLC